MPHDHYDYAGGANHLQYSLIKRRMIQQDIKWHNENLDIHNLLEHKFSLEEDNPESQNNKMEEYSEGVSLPSKWWGSTYYDGSIERSDFHIGTQEYFTPVLYRLENDPDACVKDAIYFEVEITLSQLIDSANQNNSIKYSNSSILLDAFSISDFNEMNAGFVIDQYYDQDDSSYKLQFWSWSYNEFSIFIDFSNDTKTISIPVNMLPTKENPRIIYTIGVSIELGNEPPPSDNNKNINFVKLYYKDGINDITITHDLGYVHIYNNLKSVYSDIHSLLKTYYTKNDPIPEEYSFADDYIIKVKFNYGTEPFKYKDLANQYIMDVSKIEMEEGILNE